MNTGNDDKDQKELKGDGTSDTEASDLENDRPPKPSLMESIKNRMAEARARNSPTNRSTGTRRQAKGTDRSRAFLLLAAAVVVVIFVFLAMFTKSSTPQQARRTRPNLGRPEAPASGVQEKAGSVTPLLDADVTAPDTGGDQIGPDDVKATARFRPSVPPAKPGPKTLADIAPMEDPALEAYRRARLNTAPPTPPPTGPVPAAPPTPTVRPETEALKKPSLVFVRQQVAAVVASRTVAQAHVEPALLDSTRSQLPTGTKLVARLQAAVSTAVKAPVIATVEYNYEHEGEVVVPAGTKVMGELQRANRNGTIAIRFHTLQKPDGTTEAIDAGSMSLSYGPIRGTVNGSNRAKRILVRSVTGVGTMAAYVVGGRGGFGGLNGQLNNSVLLRERIASNIGLAGEQELTSLAFSENIVVTVPGNTRFFVVLHRGSGESRTPRLQPAQSAAGAQLASGSTLLPSAQELRELIELKSELNRMYRDVSASRPLSSESDPQER